MKNPPKRVSRNATFLNQIGGGGCKCGEIKNILKQKLMNNRNCCGRIRTNEASILWNPIFLLRATNWTLKKAPTNLPSYLANTSF